MNFKSFTINYIKEPFLFPIKGIKKIFIGALILIICYLFQIFVMIVAYSIFQIYCATPQAIIDSLSILPFSILIYGYIGSIITDKWDTLPKWSDLKSIILTGVKINLGILIFMAIFGIIGYGMYIILDRIIKHTTFDFMFNLLPFYGLFYYPFIIIHEITWAFSNVIYALFYPISYNTPYYIILSIFYWIFLIISPIIIFKVIIGSNNSISINIKNHISVEYFAILILIVGCILISLVPSYVYGHIGIMPSNLFDLKYLFFEYLKDFYVFYFLIVIGRIFRNYFKNISYN